MFVVNGNDFIKGTYVCGKIKAMYIVKHFNILPYYHKKNLFYFIMKEVDIKLPWYIKLMK